MKSIENNAEEYFIMLSILAGIFTAIILECLKMVKGYIRYDKELKDICHMAATFAKEANCQYAVSYYAPLEKRRGIHHPIHWWMQYLSMLETMQFHIINTHLPLNARALLLRYITREIVYIKHTILQPGDKGSKNEGNRVAPPPGNPPFFKFMTDEPLKLPPEMFGIKEEKEE